MEAINLNGDQEQRKVIRDSKGRTPKGISVASIRDNA
ncbi:hypothetical protein COLO4_04227 [Corchorus olitorius]|uniref:Uncharacterized protein n=1 Tax=Corchorus olitorius TaxID=93759 RepID=A0A1R3KUT8_9ROSI|nr:hypothetical protein COLO4_04227 [Corchorus olitorius]